MLLSTRCTDLQSQQHPSIPLAQTKAHTYGNIPLKSSLPNPTIPLVSLQSVEIIKPRACIPMNLVGQTTSTLINPESSGPLHQRFHLPFKFFLQNGLLLYLLLILHVYLCLTMLYYLFLEKTLLLIFVPFKDMLLLFFLRGHVLVIIVLYKDMSLFVSTCRCKHFFCFCVCVCVCNRHSCVLKTYMFSFSHCDYFCQFTGIIALLHCNCFAHHNCLNALLS